MSNTKDFEYLLKLPGGKEFLSQIKKSLIEYQFGLFEIEGYDKTGKIEQMAKKIFRINTPKLSIHSLQKKDVEFILEDYFNAFMTKRETEALLPISQLLFSNIKLGKREQSFSRNEFPILDFEIEIINKLLSTDLLKLNKNTRTELIYGKHEYVLKTNIY